MNRTMRILHAEDNPDDAQLTRLALDEGGIPYELEHVSNGEEALRALRRDGPRPDIVLLDLNMPRMDGHDTLQAIKEDPELRSIPVIVLTTSISPNDVNQAYDAHVNSYMRKPITYVGLVDLMRRVEEFWAEAAVLPSEDD